MQNFIERARDLALDENNKPDENELAWATRAFSVLAIAGGLDEVNPELAEILAQTLAKAPDVVVAYGTAHIIQTVDEYDRLSSN